MLLLYTLGNAISLTSFNVKMQGPYSSFPPHIWFKHWRSMVRKQDAPLNRLLDECTTSFLLWKLALDTHTPLNACA